MLLYCQFLLNFQGASVLIQMRSLSNNIFILFKKKNNTCGESGNCHKRKIMIEYQRGTIVLQGGNLPKLHTRFAGVHKRGGGANDSF